jgi:hypothetical protein
LFTAISLVDLWPKGFAIGVYTRLVGVDSLSAILLMVTQFSAKTARHLIAVHVVAWVV